MRIERVRLPRAPIYNTGQRWPVVEVSLAKPAPTYTWPGPGGQCEFNHGGQDVMEFVAVVDTQARKVLAADPVWGGGVGPCDGW